MTQSHSEPLHLVCQSILAFSYIAQRRATIPALASPAPTKAGDEPGSAGLRIAGALVSPLPTKTPSMPFISSNRPGSDELLQVEPLVWMLHAILKPRDEEYAWGASSPGLNAASLYPKIHAVS